MDGEGAMERCVIFPSNPVGGRAPCQAPCEDLGVNAGFKARSVCVGW